MADDRRRGRVSRGGRRLPAPGPRAEHRPAHGDRTAPGRRRRVRAAVSQRALDAGAEEVLLYTDLANPVSNSIYQRIGYRPVEDRAVLLLPPAPR
jgi:hypothetical protein